VAEEARDGGAPAKQGDRKATILRAAIEVFATKGYQGCRIADVAREAKVAYGLVYHYFKNKDELLQSVFRAGWEIFVTELRAAVARGQTLEERVGGIAEVCFEAYRRDPRAVRVLVIQVARSPAVGGRNRQNAFEEIIRICAQVFVDAKVGGELRPDFDPSLCAFLFFGALEMGLTAMLMGGSGEPDPGALERAKRQVVESFLSGVENPEAAWKRNRSGTRSRAAKHA